MLNHILLSVIFRLYIFIFYFIYMIMTIAILRKQMQKIALQEAPGQQVPGNIQLTSMGECHEHVL